MDEHQLREISTQFADRLEIADLNFLGDDQELSNLLENLVTESLDTDLTADQFDALKKLLTDEWAEREILKSGSALVSSTANSVVAVEKDDEVDAERIKQMAEDIWDIGEQIKAFENHLTYREECLILKKVLGPALIKVGRQEPLTTDDVETLDKLLYTHSQEVTTLMYASDD